MTTVNLAAAILAPVEISDVTVRAYFLGQCIDLGAIGQASSTSPGSPLIVPVGDRGQGMFSYGAVVLFGLSEAAEQAFITTLKPYIQAAFDRAETKAVTIRLTPNNGGKIQDGRILKPSFLAP